MNQTFHTKLIVQTLTFILAFSITTPIAAQGLVTGDSIPAGTVLEQDAILIGQNVAINGTVNGDVFVLGNQVTVNGKVDGSLILIGQNAGIGGTVTGGVYAAALTLDLAPNSTLARDLYVATVSLTSGSDSIIGRDLYAVGLDSGLNGQVGRNLHTVIGPIQLYNGLMTLLGFDNLTIKLHFESPQPTSNTGASLISMERHARFRIAAPAPAQTFDWGQWALQLLRNWAILLVFSLLALWAARKPLKSSGESLLQTRPWQTLGKGLLVLVFTFALFGVALLLAVLIFATGLGLNSLGLWQLSIALWAAAYSCLILVLVAFWFFIAYGTKIIVIYIVGTWLFNKLFRRKAIWMDALAILAGTMVYILLRAIPYIGWVFGILVTAAGAGSGWLAWRQWRHKPGAVTATPVAEDVPTKNLRRLSTKKTGKSSVKK